MSMNYGTRSRGIRSNLRVVVIAWSFFLLGFITVSATISHAAGSYTITATAGSGGSISPSGSVTVKTGGDQTFTITPNSGYHIANVTVDNVSQGAISSYTFTNVRANHAISATFAINTYTITATAGNGGSISPSGTVVVNYGSSQAFSIAPNTGYHVADVVIDGTTHLGSQTSYTFNNVAANHTISATFAINTYTITATAGTGGTITPSSANVNYGASQTFTIAPSTGYSISDVVIDGSIHLGPQTSYTFSNITANHAISATFAPNIYTITATAGTGGTITPSSATVNYGGSQTFTITPNIGNTIAGVTVDGVPQGAISSYTFTNVTANHAILATFTVGTPMPSSSAVNYFYDDVGRLARVVQGTSGVIYNYDEVGNPVSTASATTLGGAPVLNSINPSVLFIGSKMLVILTGQNLLSTESVSAVNGLAAISDVTVTDTQITAEITALAPGTETIQVTTRGGNTATINVTLSSSTLTITPGQLALLPGTSGTLTATLSPAIGTPLTINLNNNSPATATAPQTITIPASGSASFTVNALQAGIATIDAGDPRAIVFVTTPFTGDVSGLATGNISVYVDAPAGTTAKITNPISVVVDAAPGSSPTATNPVSIVVDAPPGTSPTVAEGVSVKIQ